MFVAGFITVGCVLLDQSVSLDQTDNTEISSVEEKPHHRIFPSLRAYMRLEETVRLPKLAEINTDLHEKKLVLNHNGFMRFGTVKVPHTVVANVIKAAKTTHMDPALLLAIADKESNFKTQARAKTSSATGLFQFIDRTWLKAMKLWGHQLAYNETQRQRILNLRTDPYLSALFAANMLKSYGNDLSDKIGRPLTPGETYLIHFLGPNDAEKFMRTVAATPHVSAAALLPKPAQANKPIFYAKQGTPRTVAQVKDAFDSMMGTRFKRYQNVAGKLPAGVIAYTD